MEFLHLLRILFRKKWIILAFVLFGSLVAFLLTLRMKPVYKSTAQLSTGFTLSEDIKLADEGFNLSQIEVKFNNAIENITSPKVMSLLSYRLMLHDLNASEPFRKPNPKKVKESEVGGLNKKKINEILTHKIDSIKLLNTSVQVEKEILDYLKIYEYHMSDLLDKLYVGRQQRTDYINVVYRSENPELSAYVVNTLCKEFEYYFDAERKSRAIQSLITLDSLAKKKKEELDRKVEAKNIFLNDSIAVNDQDVGASKISQLSQYENYLVDEQGKVQDLTYQIEYLEKQLHAEKPVTTQVPVNENGTSNSEMLILRRQYNDLYDQYTRGGSTEVGIRRQLDDLQQKIKILANSQSVTVQENSDRGPQRSTLQQSKINAEGMLRSANTKITFYKSKIAELKGAITSSMPRASAKLEQMDKDIDIATMEYANAKERINLASNMEGTPSNFRQTIYGQSAIEPEPAQRIMIIGLSAASAFLLSSVFFLFIAYLDRSIKTPSQFTRQTGLSLLGVVNMVNFKKSNIIDQVTQIENEQRKNSFRELLRKLRYEIGNSGKRIILFTSTEAQQGKTTLVQALAFSFSLGKKKVLLIDTNFCNNDLSSLNSAQPKLEEFSGVSDQINEITINDMVTESGVPFVDILGCTGGDYTPSEILPEKHLLNYLPKLLDFYDYVFLEGAPLNGFTDSKELSEYVEGVIAIFSASIEIKESDKESIQFLHKLDTKFLGAILNKVKEADLNL